MSFSQNVKTELARVQMAVKGQCCNYAYISAVTKGCGSLMLSSQGAQLSYDSASLPLLTQLRQLLSQLFGQCYSLINSGDKARQGRKMHELVVMSAQPIIQQLSLTDALLPSMGIPNAIAAKDCCLRCYLRGLFAACISIKLPTEKHNGYHMETVLSSSVLAHSVVGALKSLGITARLAKRAENTVVYIKDSQHISDLLALLNASSSVLAIQNLIVQREFNNDLNRAANTRAYNVDKSLTASARQVTQIKQLQLSGELDKLTQPLQQLCQIRLAHPTATLEQLAQMQNTTKSTINHRFRKLQQLYDTMTKQCTTTEQKHIH